MPRLTNLSMTRKIRNHSQQIITRSGTKKKVKGYLHPLHVCKFCRDAYKMRTQPIMGAKVPVSTESDNVKVLSLSAIDIAHRVPRENVRVLILSVDQPRSNITLHATSDGSRNDVISPIANPRLRSTTTLF